MAATVRSCSPKDWEQIVAKATELAKRGDATARTFLRDCLLGKDPLGVLSLVDDLRSEWEALRNGQS